MTDMEKSKMLIELSRNENFIRAMKNTESKQDVQNVLAKFGFDFSCEEVDAFLEMAIKANQEELAADDLDEVSGGAGITALQVLGWAWSGTKAIAKTCWNAGKQWANWGF